MKKLQLKKEIVANLDNNQSSKIKGGNQSTTTMETVYTWGPSEMMCQATIDLGPKK